LIALHNKRLMMVFLVAHARVEKFEDPEASAYDRYSPRLHKHATALISEWCDAVLFATRRFVTRSEDAGFGRQRSIAAPIGAGGGERILRTTGGPACVAKNRYGLQPELPLSSATRANLLTLQQPHKENLPMADLYGFDANQVDPSTDFEPIPAGRYVAMITSSEQKPTKSGSGTYLQITFQILEGEYKGRCVWTRLNLQNANAMAVQIARSQLSALCRAVGVMTPRDSVELHNLPLQIQVRIKRRNDTEELENVVSGFSKKETPVAQQAATGAPPWRRS
jgi:hypothetical protein